MILSGELIRAHDIIKPHCPRTRYAGLSYGEGPAGYDIRLGRGVSLICGHTTLGVSYEEFNMPNNVLGLVKDKSTWARQGVFVQNTVIEPGWRGYLTLEISYNPLSNGGVSDGMYIDILMPIAQIIFFYIAGNVIPYEGKYQNQGSEPTPAIMNK